MEKLIDAMNSTGFEMSEDALATPRYILYRYIRPNDGDRFITYHKVYANNSNTLAKCDLFTFTSNDDSEWSAFAEMVNWCKVNEWEFAPIDNPWWKVEVFTKGDRSFATNGMMYASADLAIAALNSLTDRWFAVQHGQIRPANKFEVVDELLKTINGPNSNIVKEPKI